MWVVMVHDCVIVNRRLTVAVLLHRAPLLGVLVRTRGTSSIRISIYRVLGVYIA